MIAWGEAQGRGIAAKAGEESEPLVLLGMCLRNGALEAGVNGGVNAVEGEWMSRVKRHSCYEVTDGCLGQSLESMRNVVVLGEIGG